MIFKSKRYRNALFNFVVQSKRNFAEKERKRKINFPKPGIGNRGQPGGFGFLTFLSRQSIADNYFPHLFLV